MKATFSAICLLGVLLPTLVPAQSPNAAPIFTSEQLIPLLKRYDLVGLAKLVGKKDTISAKEVEIYLGDDGWDKLPFTRMWVADDHVDFKTTDKHSFTYCPFPPPTLEELLKARSLSEMVNLLVPARQPGSEGLRTPLGLPITMQELERVKRSFLVGLRTAYLSGERLIWIRCLIRYSGSEAPRNMDTPFLSSSISVSASPTFK